MYDSLATTWTVACQAALSIGFSKQEYWSGLPFPSPGNLPDQAVKPASPALAGRCFTAVLPGKPLKLCLPYQVDISVITHSFGQTVGKLILSYIADQSADWDNHFWMGIWQYLKRRHLTFEPVILHIEIYSEFYPPDIYLLTGKYILQKSVFSVKGGYGRIKK